MRVFVAVLVLIFSLQSWTKAEDISDFEIEGMSIGDSALNYFSEKEINKYTYEAWPNNTYVQFCSNRGNYNQYEYICFAYLKKDQKYIIEQLSGEIDLSYNDCLKKKKEIVSEIENNFKSAEKFVTKNKIHKGDKEGKSIYSQIQFIFKDGSGANVSCVDWSDEVSQKEGWIDYLGLFLGSQKFINWNKTKAFN